SRYSRYERRRGRLDEWRRAQERGQESIRRSRDDWRSVREEERRRARERETRAAAPGAAALSRTRSGPFGAPIDTLVRGCAVQAPESENWPSDAISEAVAPDEAQRNALTNLRNAANEAAQRLAKDCPQEVPAAPAARLEAVAQGIDAALKAYDVV